MGPDAGFFGGGAQADGRFAHGFATEGEGAEVHGDEGAGGAEVEVGLESVFRAGVDGAVAVGEVSTDGQKGDLRLQTAADLAEAVEVGGVARVVEGMTGTGDAVAAEEAVGVREHAGTPVFGGGEGDFDAGVRAVAATQIGGLPPFEFGDQAEAELADEIGDALRNDDLWRDASDFAGLADNFAQGRQVQVVHVRVGEKDGVDGRQVFDAQAGTALSAEEDERAGEDGVDEQVAAGDLDQERGVADEGDAEVVRVDEERRLRLAFEWIAVAFTSDAVELPEFAEDRRM